MEITHNSLMTKLNYNEHGEITTVRCREKQSVSQKAITQLTQFPDEYRRLTVLKESGESLKEVFGHDDVPYDGFKVNYNSGIVFFNQKQIGETLTFDYFGKGMDLISTNRVFHKYDKGDECVVETLDEITDDFITKSTDLIKAGETAITEITETNQQMKINESERVTAEQNRQENESQRMAAETNRQQQEDGRVLAETLRATCFDSQINQWGEEHLQQMGEFDTSFGEVIDQMRQQFDDKLVDFGETVDEQTQSRLTQFQQTFDTSLTEWDDAFHQNIKEWEGEVAELGEINDQEVTPLKTWSSQKINQEIQSVGKTTSDPHSVVRRNENGDIEANSLLVGLGGVIHYGDQAEYGINQQLYTTGKKGGYTRLLTGDDMSSHYEPERVVVRGADGSIVVSAVDFPTGDKVTGDGEKLYYQKTDSFNKLQIITSDDLRRLETGTWTPVPMVDGGDVISVTSHSSHYSVVGNMVLATTWFKWDSVPSNLSGRFIVRGLPFLNKGNATAGSLGVRVGLKTPADVEAIFCEIPSNGTTEVPEIRFYQAKNGTGGSYQCTNLASAGEVHISVVYITN